MQSTTINMIRQYLHHYSSKMRQVASFSYGKKLLQQSISSLTEPEYFDAQLASSSAIKYQLNIEDFSMADYTSKFNRNLNTQNVITLLDEGEYVTLNSAELDKYLPEGLSGDSNEEFQFSGQKSWMVRNSGKLLCRIIDEFNNTDTRSKNHVNISTRGKLNINGLTDKPEWNNCSLNVKSNGLNVSSDLDNQRTDTIVSNIKKVNTKNIPSTILISGNNLVVINIS